jgi:hypothetical protein
MYMDDAIEAPIRVMQASAEQIKIRSSYNLAAMSFSPKEIAAEIQKHTPDFTISYSPNFCQKLPIVGRLALMIPKPEKIGTGIMNLI